MGFQFGKIKEVKVDDNTKITLEKNIVGGKINLPTRTYYEERIKVGNQKDELTEYLKFSDEIQRDKSILDPRWRIEKNKSGNVHGYYYVVKCWTKLDY